MNKVVRDGKKVTTGTFSEMTELVLERDARRQAKGIEVKDLSEKELEKGFLELEIEELCREVNGNPVVFEDDKTGKFVECFCIAHPQIGMSVKLLDNAGHEPDFVVYCFDPKVSPWSNNLRTPIRESFRNRLRYFANVHEIKECDVAAMRVREGGKKYITNGPICPFSRS